MKQHITVEQLNELDGENLQKFRELITSDKGWQKDDFVISTMVTIGKMIEILNCKIPYYYINKTNVNIWKGKTHKYTIKTLYERNYNYGENDEYNNLCDALWEAVKYVLEEDNE